MSATFNLLSARRRTHGDFAAVAELYQALLATLRAQPRWPRLTVPQRVALEMICLKQARLLCGDPGFPDHWHDIAGYAALGAGDGDAEDGA